MTFAHVGPPVFMRWALLVTLAYAVWCLLWRFRRGNPVLLAALPLILNVPVTWFGLGRVAEAGGYGGGGAAMAAGIAEALVSTFLGAAISATLAAVGAIILRRQRPVALLILAVACVLFAIATWRLVDAYRRVAMTPRSSSAPVASRVPAPDDRSGIRG